jgi:transmembrane sensor
VKSTSDYRSAFLKIIAMDRDLLGKYLTNRCNEDELNEVLDWFRNSSGTPEGENLLFSAWEGAPLREPEKYPDFEALLDRIHHEVNTRQAKTGKRTHLFLRILRNAAAILLLPALGYGLFISGKYYSAGSVALRGSYNEVFSSVDAIINVTLPDGSRVWLNHNSSLKYPALFSGNIRKVQLNGEGYFEVSGNKKMPFIVKAGDIEVVALGTKFNVMAYPEEDRIETSLIEGNVEIRKADSPDDDPLYRMKPSEVMTYYEESRLLEAKSIIDDRYFSWKSGKLVFSAESMDEVVRKLSRWFNVDIMIKDANLTEMTLTATFVNETLPQVMDLLAKLLPIRYSISQREATGDGTFTKRKVVIDLKK